jgi:hypothetical protein
VAGVSYAPAVVPQTVEDLPRYTIDELYKINAALDNKPDRANELTYFPFKWLMVSFTGNGAGVDPTVRSDAYNVDVATGVTMPVDGVYWIDIKQDTIEGVDIASLGYAFVTVAAAGNIATYARFVPGGAPAGSIQISVYRLTVSGQDIVETLYPLAAGEACQVTMLVNIVSPSADPLPE